MVKMAQWRRQLQGYYYYYYYYYYYILRPAMYKPFVTVIC